MYSGAPHVENELRYLLTGCGCSTAPVVITLLLPEPWRSSLAPLAALFGGYALLFVIALLLYVGEWLWKIVRPRSNRLECSVCHSVEQPYRLFFVRRVAPSLVRVECPECHEHWLERR